MTTRPAYQDDLFPHWMNISTRFRDLDPLNHVNNAIYSTYYEEARIQFIEDVPQFANQLKNGYSFVLARLEIDFIRPIKYPARLLLGSGIRELGNSSISSFQAIYTSSDKKLVSVARAHGVWYNLDKQRPSRLPKIPSLDNLMVTVTEES